MKNLAKNFIFILLIFLIVSSVFALFNWSSKEEKNISLTQLVREVNQEKIKEITVSGQKLSILYQNGERAKSRKEPEIDLHKVLANWGASEDKLNRINIKNEPEKQGVGSWLMPLLIFGILPLVIFAIFFWMIFRQAKSGAAQAFSFTKARARLFGANGKVKEKVTFKDVAGLKEAKEELKEIIDFLRSPKKYLQMGARIPRGVLLIGPPGTGKTLLARAVASQAGVPFFSISGSEFIEMFVGVGSARVRDLFSTAKKHQPSIIFIDELDAIGRVRGAGIGGGHDEREQTLNQILVEMDGFEKEATTLIFAASIAGDTPVLIKQNNECKLLPISQVIDPYYKNGEERIEKFVDGLEVLGFEKKTVRSHASKTDTYFQNSAFKKVRSVYRHKANEIYLVKYDGGEIKTTGSHSLFIKDFHGIRKKLVSEMKPGDVLVDLPPEEATTWRLEFAKTQNSLNVSDTKATDSAKKAIIREIKRISYDGYVYDFCGCENEAFFAGEKPVLASNTNRPDVLDPALLRPGRFDRRVILDLPDIGDREAILKIHCRNKPLSIDVNLREVAERTPGFSGADLANLANEAAILTAKRDKRQICQEELLESIEKVLLGPERKSHILSKKEKEITAYHETGHALVSSFLPGTEPIRKVSIIARGMAAGYTLKMPSEEKKMKTKKEFLAEIATLLGGYCAEKIKFGEITTGASDDLKKATELARKLVKEYGMSSLGPISFGEKEELIFLGKEISEERNYSEEVAAEIDKEIKKFIKNGEQTALKILSKRKEMLDKMARVLIEKETIEREEFERLSDKNQNKSKKKHPKTAKPRPLSLKVKIKKVKS